MAYLADFSSRRLSSLLKTAASTASRRISSFNSSDILDKLLGCIIFDSCKLSFQKILSSDGVEEFWAEIKLKLEQSYQLALTKMKLYSVWFD